MAIIHYLDKIDSFVKQFDAETISALQSISTRKLFKKGEYLLRQNEYCRHSYFVEEGILRKYYLHDGKEITTELFFQNDVAVSLNSYVFQQPSYESIQALIDTTVSITAYNSFQHAKVKYPKLMELDLLMTEYYALWLEQRLFEFHTQNATQRYTQLMAKHPHIIQHVPLTYIASYIGISLETLSRIRARM
jgi:CRP-like cAMP-binding protein